jgi:hypothetical protein
MKPLSEYKKGELTHFVCECCGERLVRASWEGLPALYSCTKKNEGRRQELIREPESRSSGSDPERG